MKTIMSLIALALIVAYGFSEYRRGSQWSAVGASAASNQFPRAVKYFCDGRTHCSQMTSCAEATYFLSHCPGTKMDGDNDGIPCEKQWCN